MRRAPFVLYDTEYTCWKGSNTSCWKDFRQPRHLIQIGALRVSPFPDSKILEKKLWFVKPDQKYLAQRFNVTEVTDGNPDDFPISKYFTDLTRVTRQQIDDQGISIQQFYKEFRDFVGSAHAFSYGCDEQVLYENLFYANHVETCDELSLDYARYGSWVLGHSHDLHSFFAHQSIDIRLFTSGTLHQAFDIPADEVSDDHHVHDAMWDVNSLYQSLRRLYAHV